MIKKKEGMKEDYFNKTSEDVLYIAFLPVNKCFIVSAWLTCAACVTEGIDQQR